MLAHTTYTQPFTLIIFGATGDLAKKKLFPDLFTLFRENRISSKAKIIGYGRSPLSQEEFREELRKEVWGAEEDKTLVQQFLSAISYTQGTYTDTNSISHLLEEHKKTLSTLAPLLYYFALPAHVVEQWSTQLCHSTEKEIQPLFLIEKPFGTSEDHASELFHHFMDCIGEKQLYLVDHYLGKSAVQSILHLRHANPILTHLLKGPYIEKIEIRALEKDDVENRLGYYDKMGALKDMVQSHLLQLIALLLMDIPKTLDPTHMAREKAAILNALLPDQTQPVYFGQYTGYGVVGSTTETSIKATVRLDRSEWSHIPITLETGKKLKEKRTDIVITFKDTTQINKNPNQIIIEIAPSESLKFTMTNHYNGFEDTTPVEVATTSSLSCHGDDCLPEHGRLILEALHKRKISFSSMEEVLAGWRLVAALEKIKEKIGIQTY